MKSKNETPEIVHEIKKDFESRRTARRSLESQWQLNMNFLMGNQYSYIGSNGSITEDRKQYFWQEKEVFNHIAPTIETRASKISRLKPNMTVLPASTDEGDMQSARVSKDILNAVSNKIGLGSLTKQAIVWSEVCGTAFYKISWNTELGQVVATDEVGKSIREGDIEVMVCSPFEIFPDNLSCENIEDMKSLIHAKAYHVDEVYNIWGVKVSGESVRTFSLDSGYAAVGGLGYDASISKIADIELADHCLVIEKYTAPSRDMPNGRLTIIAGEQLLFDGDLPYINGELGGRCIPYAKQVSVFMPGSFFGISVIDRLIPVQRAFNAIRNRKHEYINRLSLGVVTVEDGSVDTEMLEEEGLSPGKVLVYRQGSKEPSIMQVNSYNDNFDREESLLLEEFKVISGVSDLMSKAYANYTNMSGIALQLLSEQDDTRLAGALDSVKDAMKMIGKYILRMYRQFAVLPRLLKLVGENGKVEMYYWNSSEISSDDVVLDTNTDVGESVAQKRNMVLELLKNGLLYDEEGKLSKNMRKKCLDLLGFGIWEHAQDIQSLHMNQAQEENINMLSNVWLEPTEIDDHSIHIIEHTAFVLGELFKKKDDPLHTLRSKYITHIANHKSKIVE